MYENSAVLYDEKLPKVFHDQASLFMSIKEPKAGDELTLRLRAEKDALSVAELHYMLGGKLVKHPMKNVGSKLDKSGRFDYFEVTFKVPKTCILYRFYIVDKKSGQWYYYTQRGVDGSNFCVTQDIPMEDEKYNDSWSWDIKYYGWQILPGFKTPDWAKGAVWYSIAPDAFYNGDPTNDDSHSDWNYDQPWNISHNGLDDRYGGDLQGIIDKADYFKDLGVDGVFFNPICKSNQNMGYGTTDHNQIESSFGNADKYSELISYMHSKDLRLMHDVVIYFTMRDGIYCNKDGHWPKPGAYKLGKEELDKNNHYYSMIYDADNGGLNAWGGVTLNNYDEVTKSVLYSKPTSALARYADPKQGFGVDGYRFDCGGFITGHDGTTDTFPWTEEQIKQGKHSSVQTVHVMHDIRKYIKKVNPDVDLLSESSGHQLRTGCWDSQWLLSTNNMWQLFIKGEKPMKDVRHSIVSCNLWEKPRGTCECSKQQMNTHDENSCARRKENAHMWRAARLMQMTVVGSPSVYYGDETNFSGDTFAGGNGHNMKGFSYFDWDEANWDFEVNNFIKACLKLRKTFPLMRDGAMVEVYLDENNYDFARFDENNAVFTMTTTSSKVTKRTLDVTFAGVADGTVMTDWFTGAKYIVENGKINVELAPGGTIIVTGTESSEYRMGYSVENIGKAKVKDVVSDSREKSVVIKGADGKLLSDKDSVAFVNLPVFGSVVYEASVEGNGAVLVRNGLSADDIFVGVVAEDKKMKVVARKKTATETVVLAQVNAGSKVKIERYPDNTVKVYIDGKAIKDAEIKLPFNDKIYAGFTAVSGDAKVTPSKLEKLKDRPLFDDFSCDVPSAMFKGLGKASVKGGMLSIPTNCEVLTRSENNDWTFKAELKYVPKFDGDYAGVVSDQDGKAFAIVGRRFADGKVKLFFAKASNGQLVIRHEQDDSHPEKNVIVQLQRIGTGYTAVYSYDGVYWNGLGKDIFLNLSLENVGVKVAGKTEAKVKYVSFGDAVNDKKSTNIPHTPDTEPFGLTDSRYLEHFKYKDVMGKWDYAEEGFIQTGLKEAAIVVENKKYISFRAEATFKIEKGKGYIGMSFGMPTPKSQVFDYYTLRYTSDDAIVLMNGTNEISKVNAKPFGKSVRLVLEVEDGMAVVYSGKDATPIIQAKISDYKPGYFAYSSNGVVGRVMNMNICSTNGALYGSDRGFEATNNDVKIVWGGNTTVWLRGHAYTDYVMTTTVEMNRFNPGKYHAGLLLCGDLGINYYAKGAGIYLKIEDGKLHLVQGDKVLAEPKDLQDASKVKFIVTKQGKNVKVYVDKIKTPFFDFNIPVNTGTVWSAVSSNTNTLFTDIAIEEIFGDANPLDSEIAKDIR